MSDLYTELKRVTSEERVLRDADMGQYCSFRAGGRAAFLVEPAGISELKAVLGVLDGRKHMVMGNGTNLLFRDAGYDGTVVRLAQRFSWVIQLDENAAVDEGEPIGMFSVGAGTLLSSAAKYLLTAGYGGFEFAGGIPGSMGGAAFMNAGAYDHEMKEIIGGLVVVPASGGEERFVPNDELQYGYRTSALQESGDIVVAATLLLGKGDREKIAAKMRELGERRNAKQPVNYPSAGSFFKRPPGHFAGRLIEDAGLKGLTVGGAQVSELHAGFIINTGNATASDIIRLSVQVQKAVLEQSGVMLEPEVRIVG